MARWIGAGIGCVGLLASVMTPVVARAQQPAEPRLVIAPQLLARIQTLAAGLHNEIVLCLTGTTDESTTTADGFVMPDPNVSHADRASFGSCPRDAVAIWHNHPLDPRSVAAEPTDGDRALPTLNRPRPHGDSSLRPVDLCVLSQTDIRTAAREAAPFVVVSVDRDTWCWWSLDQVRKLAASNALRGSAVPGQIALRGSYQPH